MNCFYQCSQEGYLCFSKARNRFPVQTHFPHHLIQRSIVFFRLWLLHSDPQLYTYAVRASRRCYPITSQFSFYLLPAPPFAAWSHRVLRSICDEGTWGQWSCFLADQSAWLTAGERERDDQGCLRWPLKTLGFQCFPLSPVFQPSPADPLLYKPRHFWSLSEDQIQRFALVSRACSLTQTKGGQGHS